MLQCSINKSITHYRRITMENPTEQVNNYIERSFDAVENLINHKDKTFDTVRKNNPFDPMISRTEQFMKDSALLGVGFARELYGIQKKITDEIATKLPH